MNRKLIAIAVGAALAAPAAIADITVSGKVRLSYGAIEEKDNGVTTVDNFQMSNQASRLGFKGSEDLGNGLKANFFVEWGINPDSDGKGELKDTGGSDSGVVGDGTSGLSRRNQWVGLSGDSWGEVRFGRHDTPLKFAQGKVDVFNDTFGDFAKTLNGVKVALGDDRVDNVLAYISPRWSGFGFAIAGIPGEETGTGSGVDDGAVDRFSANATYKNGPIFASVGHTDLSADSASDDRDTTTRLVGTYKLGAAQIGAMYEMNDFEASGGGALDEYNVWGVSGKYRFGNNAVKAQYHLGTSEYVGATPDDDTQRWSIGFDHYLSKRTDVYAQYTTQEHEDGALPDDEFEFIGVGINHKF